VNPSNEYAPRLMLLCQDRVGGGELRLTQEFLAQMLGTRRSRVCEAAIILQGVGRIRYSRGIITILDREGLEEFVCECYRAVRDGFDRLFIFRHALQHVSGSSGLQRTPDFAVAVRGGQHDDASLGKLTSDCDQGVGTVSARKQEVHQRDVRPVTTEFCDRFCRIGCLRDQ
jgi:hypothetical protein